MDFFQGRLLLSVPDSGPLPQGGRLEGPARYLAVPSTTLFGTEVSHVDLLGPLTGSQS